MTASHRSIVPTIPGVPSWGAVLIAITFTVVGFAFERDPREGTDPYLCWGLHRRMHCRSARGAAGGPVHRRHSATVAPVRHRACRLLPLSRRRDDGIKDLAINCGYPLIERFPLMFFTSAIVLLIGMSRWYQGMSSRRAAPAAETVEETEGLFSVVTSKIASLLAREPEDQAAEAPAPRRSRQHSIDRAGKAGKTAAGTARTRSGRPVKRAQPSRSRHTRPPETEIIEPVAERPRRPRTARRTTDPTVPPAEPRRRPRASSAREPRKQPPPSERRSPYQRPDRHSRFDGFEPFEPQGTKGSNGRGSLNGTHHPVSRVRYRGARRRGTASGAPNQASRVQAPGRRVGVRRLVGSSGAPGGSRGAARRPASRWQSSPVAPCRSRIRPAAPARREPAPRGPKRPR